MHDEEQAIKFYGENFPDQVDFSGTAEQGDWEGYNPSTIFNSRKYFFEDMKCLRL